MGSTISAIQRTRTSNNPPVVGKATEGVLRCGILGAARIAPDALITPAKNHSEITIYAVAARDKTKAETFAKKYGIPKVFSGSTGYQQMIDDPEVDVIYNPLPNGLHYEWTLKALKAGKHVLLEKPSTNTEEDTRFLFDFAKQRGLVLLEAFHPRFHPAINRVKEIVDSGELGKLKSVSAHLCLPWQMLLFSDDDIRYKFELGGGTIMDMGCYTLAMVRYVTSAEPTAVLSATAEPIPNPKGDVSKRNIDVGATASLAFPDDVTASIACHSRWHGWGPFGILPRLPDIKFTAICEGGTVEGKTANKRTEKAFKFPNGLGEEWWSTYRYQLEFFVDKLKGRKPQVWMEGDDSTANMRAIEMIYEKTGLGSRPKAEFALSD